MPEHLRALVVIFLLSALTFLLLSKPASDLGHAAEFKLRRNLWFCLTLAAFLSSSFWLYATVLALLLLVTAKRVHNKLAMFFCIAFVLPVNAIQIPGFGLINYLVALNHIRLVSLFLLLPAAVLLATQHRGPSPSYKWPDRLLLTYLAVASSLEFRDVSVTEGLRQSFYLLIDLFLPYYVASRCLKDLRMFSEALFAFVAAVLFLAVVGIFEYARHWLLYSSVVGALDLLPSSISPYLIRSGSLRATASAGHSIALGYLIAVAIGAYCFVSAKISQKIRRLLIGLILTVGAVATLSRGPWVGIAVVLGTYAATGKNAMKNLSLLAVATLLALPALSVIPGGNRLLDLLPFIGNIEKENISYRERLIDNALLVIERNPLFGSPAYMLSPELESMRQGQGIIDIVNTYIGVALEYGLVGLSLFAGFFLSVIYGMFKALRSIRQVNEEMHRLGRALFATLAGILVIIFTVSSITVIPIVYWSVAGLCVAYVQIVRKTLNEHRTASASA